MARPKPLADFIDACLGRSLAAQGFAASDVIVAWPEIVGERLSYVCQPVKLDWPRRESAAGRERRPDPATLVVRVESAFALELQHLAPLIAERINAHYGWRCVGRIVLKQGPVSRPKPRDRIPPILADEDRDRVAAATSPIGEDSLRIALNRLGAAVLGIPANPTSTPPAKPSRTKP